MESGAHVWCQDYEGDEAWLLAEVTSRTDSAIDVFLINDPSNKFTRERDETVDGLKYKGVELANAKLSESDKAEGRDNDLITLPHLHEPALLHAIEERFFEDKIYTWTGPVLIAVNPFQRLPLYTRELLELYRRDGLLRSQEVMQSVAPLAPHVYSIADRAYRQMMSAKGRSQAILISGESGAGKTETTKIVMFYLSTLGSATVSESEEKKGEEISVMDKVLNSNPILEAFGNARTLRNDNSSRFGKFIELGFSRSGHLLGAKVQTYLLEKVRLGSHASGERNYHIFYQILRGATEEQKEHYGFHDGDTGGLELPNCFYYTSQGGAPHLREFTDEAGLNYTVKAMRSMGWSEEKIDKVLSLCAGILHLGQTQFVGVASDGDDIAEISDESVVKLSARLLGVDEEKLKIALLQRMVVTRSEKIAVPLSPEKAHDARDALAKTFYGALFLWVVSQVNECVTWDDENEVRSSCGVLDIFGFELFKVNSFEQLCINYTNEALQQQFNKFIFKMEQDEYERENIEWAFISFPDNQDCLDMIESRPNGLLTMLNDECRVPKGSDRNWASRMYKHYGETNKRFSASALQKTRSIFCVIHFAGLVPYSADTGFLEKNKDEIPITAQTLFETAPLELVREVYGVQKKALEEQSKPKAGAATTPGKRSGGGNKQKTVAQQFKEQLNSLIAKIESTEPHYIRCLKPNDAAKSHMMVRRRLTEQLRYGGVLEAIRVARMGFPIRMDHGSFYQRYRMLLPTTSDEILPRSMENQDAQKLCVELVDFLLKCEGKVTPSSTDIETKAEKVRRMQLPVEPITFPRTEVQLGLHKVFLRKAPHDSLEAHRTFHQNVFAIVIQSEVRRYQQQTDYIIMCAAALTAQRFYRGCMGRDRWWRLKRVQCAFLLTKNFRMLLQWRWYTKLRNGTILLQAVYRGWTIRRKFAALKIQTYYRMYSHKYKFLKLRSATISVQCSHRRRLAFKLLAQLKAEQKNIGSLKKNNEQLKSEMASLKAMLAAVAKEDSNLAEHKKELEIKEHQISELEKKVLEIQKELEKEKIHVEHLQKEIQTLRVESKKQIASMRTTMSPPTSPRPRSKKVEPQSMPQPQAPQVPPEDGGVVVNPAVLTQHLAEIARLERDLEAEKHRHREADGEIIKLRAAMNGVKLNDSDVNALIAPPEIPDLTTPVPLNSSVKSVPTMETVQEKDETEQTVETKKVSDKNEEAPEDSKTKEHKAEESNKEEKKVEEKPVTPKASEKKKPDSVTPEVASTLGKLGLEHPLEEKKARATIMRSPSEYFPLIRRGFLGENTDDNKVEDEEELAVGWKVDFANRKEREESLRDEVRRFMIRMKKFYPSLEDGVDITLWQLCRKGESDDSQNFAVKASHSVLKLTKRGEKLLQAVLSFSAKGSMLSKALGRGSKAVIDPLALNEILDIKAGCVGFDIGDLPSSNAKKRECGFKHSNLFITLRAAPTPLFAERLYFLRFKSRGTRNDLMNGLRGLLADLQIHEGVSISTMQIPKSTSHHAVPKSPTRPGAKKHAVANGEAAPQPHPHQEDITVPLGDVHKAINKQRKQYDRLLLMLLQGFSDLKDKEDDVSSLHSKLESVVGESAEKDRIHEADSKLIMQLSKKLETLLMSNEDLRESNDRLNARLVVVECEKMNMSV